MYSGAGFIPVLDSVTLAEPGMDLRPVLPVCSYLFSTTGNEV